MDYYADASQKERSLLDKRLAMILTCEHGGNRVPVRYSHLFRGKGRLLQSHRGYDPGTLELARRLSAAFDCQLFYSTVTRLLVDLNRSQGNPRRFSRIVRTLNTDELDFIRTRYYLPYHEAVLKAVNKNIMAGSKVLHISVHSFSPYYRGSEREADIGLLYDPKRRNEAEFCAHWRRALASVNNFVRVRRNYPYYGVSDGLTSCFRRLFNGNDYMGIETEINQRYPMTGGKVWRRFISDIALSLARTLSCPS